MPFGISPNYFECLPDEALEAVIRDARNTLAERRRGVSPRTLPGFLDLNSQNFMGMGMSIRELVATNQVERNLRSYGQQTRQEQQRRLDFVIRLSAELIEILKVTHFSAGLARHAIADVFEGDWSGVKVWAELFFFTEELAEIRDKYMGVYGRFRLLLIEALETVPTPEAESKAPD